MIEFLGMACVSWTVFEIVRMGRLAGAPEAPRERAPGRVPRPPRSHSAAHAGMRPSPRFAAWDDRGRPIRVEDLGSAS